MEKCQQHETLDKNISEIKGMLKEISNRLGNGDVSLATLKIRLRIVEILVYGAVGVALASLLKAVLSDTNLPGQIM